MQELNERFKQIYKAVEKFCFDREDPIRAIRNMHSFNEGYDAFGLQDEDLKILRDRILQDFKPSPREIADFGLILLKTGKYEFGSLAILLIKKHRPRLDSYIRERLKEWLDSGVENWAHADLLGTKILPVLFELELTDLQSFTSWRDSHSKWTRRASITCLMWLRDELPVDDILRFIEPVVADNENVVQQALGWLLKDLWHKENEPVEAFLSLHKEDLDRSTIKQATSRMPLSKAKIFLPHNKAPHKAARDSSSKNRNGRNSKPRRNNRNQRHKNNPVSDT